MKALSRIFIAACVVAALAPLAWHLLSSFKDQTELAAVPPTLLPHELTLANYSELFARRPFLRYCMNSLTIAAIDPGDGPGDAGPLVGITIIPHTAGRTTLGFAKPGTRLNIEADVLAKHLEKLLTGTQAGPASRP